MPTKRWTVAVIVLMLSLLFMGGSASGLMGTTQPQPTPTPLLTPGVESNNWLYRSKLSVRTFEDIETFTPTPTPSPTVTPASAVAVAPKPASPPVKSVQITGSGALGWPLTHPTKVNTYFSGAHQAIDLEAKCGETVLNAFDGQVLFAGWKSNGGGIVIDVQTDNGLVLNYVHLSNFSVQKGDQVTRGQTIGASGATGIATGCHLHFGVVQNGAAVNPLLFL